MKNFLAIIFVVFLLSSYLIAQPQVKNNIALLSLGATAEDNGSFSDYGIDRDATATIDGDSTTYLMETVQHIGQVCKVIHLK